MMVLIHSSSPGEAWQATEWNLYGLSSSAGRSHAAMVGVASTFCSTAGLDPEAG